MAEIYIKQVGLAAYAKSNGSRLLGYESATGFVFDSEKSEEQWEVEYLGSDESRFNSALINLMKLKRKRG